MFMAEHKVLGCATMVYDGYTEEIKNKIKGLVKEGTKITFPALMDPQDNSVLMDSSKIIEWAATCSEQKSSPAYDYFADGLLKNFFTLFKYCAAKEGGHDGVVKVLQA